MAKIPDKPTVKVTVHQNADQTPSQQAVAKAAASVNVADSRGRVITLKKPGVLAQFRLIEALGETATNQTYVAMVLPLIFVTAVDGEMAVPPTTKSEVEALIQRLDEDGINAVMLGVRDNFGQTDPEADREALKK